MWKETDLSGPIAFCPSRWREVDMAILLRADVLVLSTGTFSWWIGYLSKSADKVSQEERMIIDYYITDLL